MIAAVTFDLDDTLYPQSEYLAGAWDAVAEAGARLGLDPEMLRLALEKVAAGGSDRGGIVDRAVALIDGDAHTVAPLVDSFRAHRPARLEPYPGVARALARLRRRVPVACITDGDPAIQRAKLVALGLERAFDAVVLSDERGRQRRKPHPAPFLTALRGLGAHPPVAVHVGDRPEKDVTGAVLAGMRAIRVTTGEYTHHPDPDPPLSPWRSCPDATTAAEMLLGLLRA